MMNQDHRESQKTHANDSHKPASNERVALRKEGRPFVPPALEPQGQVVAITAGSFTKGFVEGL